MAELTDIRETVRHKYAEAAEAAARGEFKQARAHRVRRRAAAALTSSIAAARPMRPACSDLPCMTRQEASSSPTTP